MYYFCGRNRERHTMNQSKFQTCEIPYEILEKFGLTEDMIEDLPQAVLKDICAGRRSPVLPISMENEAGETIHAKTRFALVRKENEDVDILFYPVLKNSNLSAYDKEVAKPLDDKQAVVTMQTDQDGKEVQVFLQLDAQTNQILSVPTPVIGRNLQIVREEWNLTNAEMNALEKGLPVSFEDNGTLVTIGIDLTTPYGLRMVEGDEKKWRKAQVRGMEKHNFGLYGCWIVGDDGTLEYVSEENYSEELLEEQRKKIKQRSAMSMK